MIVMHQVIYYISDIPYNLHPYKVHTEVRMIFFTLQMKNYVLKVKKLDKVIQLITIRDRN